MRLAFLSPGDPHTPDAWSGTPYFVFRELGRFCDVHYVDARWLDRTLWQARRPSRKLGWDVLREPVTSRLFAAALRPKLQALAPDLVFALASSHLVADLTADYPVVHCSDATFSGMWDYYPRFQGLSGRTFRNGEAMERKVIQGARALLYPSEWAAQSAVRDYGAAPARVFTVPFGANVELPADPGPRALRRPDGICRLLFIGVEWERKGGNLALAVAQELRRSGLETELHVVGCHPPSGLADPCLRLHGFLSKDSTRQRRLLEALFAEAAFLIVPSRQEAYGLVFCEASAYGVPSLATRTGGVPAAVEPGVNGYLFDVTAGPEAYVRTIRHIWADPDRYCALRRRTRRQYETKLNWTHWGEAVRPVLEAAAGLHPAADARPSRQVAHG